MWQMAYIFLILRLRRITRKIGQIIREEISRLTFHSYCDILFKIQISQTTVLFLQKNEETGEKK